MVPKKLASLSSYGLIETCSPSEAPVIYLEVLAALVAIELEAIAS